MVATTWVVPSAVFFTSIIGWQYFVGYRSVPVGKCYVQYMDSAIFNCLLQLGYFWATLVVMCALYTGIYRVALRLHRESAARRHNMAVVTAHATQHLGPTSSTMSTTAYKLVATATVSAARDHAQRDNDRTSVGLAAGLSDSSQSEHDVAAPRHHDSNDVTLLLSQRRSELAIELKEMSQLDTASSAMTFTVDDDDIRFADDVTEDDDDVVFRDRQANLTSENDVNLHHHHYHHLHHLHLHNHKQQQPQQQKQQQQSEHVSSRDYVPRSLLSSAPEELDMHRHSAEYRQLSRVDTANVPTRRRFYSHQRLSSRRRRRRSKATCEWHTSRSGSQVIDKLSASLRHFIRLTQSVTRCFLLCRCIASRATPATTTLPCRSSVY